MPEQKKCKPKQGDKLHRTSTLTTAKLMHKGDARERDRVGVHGTLGIAWSRTHLDVSTVSTAISTPLSLSRAAEYLTDPKLYPSAAVSDFLMPPNQLFFLSCHGGGEEVRDGLACTSR